jgi:hypothetical protein
MSLMSINANDISANQKTGKDCHNNQANIVPIWLVQAGMPSCDTLQISRNFYFIFLKYRLFFSQIYLYLSKIKMKQHFLKK